MEGIAADEEARDPDDELQRPQSGAGALVRRDYWTVIQSCAVTPHGLIRAVRKRFTEFAPPSIVVFGRVTEESDMLDVGDELSVDIKQAGTFRVRVTHADANSLTLATLRGHPEAGRITFGAYRNDHDDVIFHIRSLARSGSTRHYAGFLLAGDPMQTYTWTDFVDCVAHTFGDGAVGTIHAEVEVLSLEEDDGTMDQPTYIAQGN